MKNGIPVRPDCRSASRSKHLLQIPWDPTIIPNGFIARKHLQAGSLLSLLKEHFGFSSLRPLEKRPFRMHWPEKTSSPACRLTVESHSAFNGHI